MNTLLPEDAILLSGALNTEGSLTNTMTESLLGGLSGYIGDSLFIALLVFIRILIVVWVIKDSNHRSSSLLFQVCSVLLVTLATPLIGLPIYIAIRPLGYKHERKYRELIMSGYTIDTGSYEDVSITNNTQMPISQEKQTKSINKPKKKSIVL